MMQNKKVVGITGGSGTGKSYISAQLKNAGYLVIDADEVAHKCLEQAECAAEIRAEFGEGVIENGKPNRKKIGEIAFSEPKKLEKLGKITHKYILAEIQQKIDASDGRVVFVDGAVLIESGFKCDFMIGVLADKKIRKERIINRDKISETEAEKRISAQQEDGFYRKKCDFIIENNGGEIDITEIVKRIQ
ncbi:MAG: dephospho-CoA kinase [Clostridia bacterium]|nr:dephospho-CoA kinase [Clostridia bacterium]